MNRYFISIGSNLSPSRNIRLALQRLRARFSVKKVSSIYVTDPVGPAGRKKFRNLAVLLESPLTRASLKKHLRGIEAELGRVRDPHNRYAPRPIDLDLLPQQGYQKYGFIVRPLAEIAPRHRFGKSPSFKALAERLIARKSK